MYFVVILTDISVPLCLNTFSVSYSSANLFSSGLTGSQQGVCMFNAWTDLASIPLSTLDEP